MAKLVNNNTDDCILVDFIEGVNKESNLRETYYDNDSVVDKKEVMKRWNVKKLVDPNENLSVSHYRSRFSGQTSPSNLPVYSYKPGIFLEEKSQNKSNDKESRETVLNEQISKLKLEYEECKHKMQLLYGVSVSQVEKIYDDNLNQIQMQYQGRSNRSFRKKSKERAKEMFDKSLESIGFNYQEKVTQLEEDTNSKVQALISLHEAGIHCDSLDKYATLEVYQPQAKRKKYYDDGHRKLFLPEITIKNMLIEDEIYYYYYGIPN